jgi:hypothetical protein
MVNKQIQKAHIQNFQYITLIVNLYKLKLRSISIKHYASRA